MGLNLCMGARPIPSLRPSDYTPAFGRVEPTLVRCADEDGAPGFGGAVSCGPPSPSGPRQP